MKMSLIFQTIKFAGRFYCIKSTRMILCCLRHFSGVPRKFITFDEIIAQRRAEARQSLVVQVNSESSFNELYGYCSKFAEINGIHHYKNSGGQHFMLIEFSSEEHVKNVLHNCSSHQRDNNVMAIQSPFLWFRASLGNIVKNAEPNSALLVMKNEHCTVNEDVLSEDLGKCHTVSDQIQMLYDRTMLNDLGVRLRFMVARQLECIFASLYTNVEVKPFGSSVNGFGKMGCDLDLTLTNATLDEMTDTSKRLVYYEKKCEGRRSPWQRHMELVAELLEVRVPGAVRVLRILNARVPIVKFAHETADVDCDLCYSNLSGVYMSELLWLFGSLDARVRPLTFTIRRWAHAVGLTSPHPGRWITNFPLTLMVLFFLQQKGKDGPILPSLKYLVNISRKEDARIAEDNINCTFLRDMNILPQDSYGQNPDNLETLLLKFFEFYAQFNFQDHAISINEGKPVRKPNALPLYVVNPLEQTMNVSRNVSFEECERLRLEVKDAAWQLETALEGRNTEDWGLLSILEKKSTRSLKKLLRAGNSQRLVSVKDLFTDTEDVHIPTEDLKSKVNRLKPKSNVQVDRSVDDMVNSIKEVKNVQKVKFKNNQVANEVRRIRRDKIV